jgi:hypothetical protein
MYKWVLNCDLSHVLSHYDCLLAVKTSHDVIILVFKEISIREDLKQAFTWEEIFFFNLEAY